MIWLDFTFEHTSYESYVHKKILKMEIINILERDENWTDYDFKLEIECLKQ